MLKVLGRETSINVRKVLWALDALRLPYERENWGLPLRDPRTPEFLALNPNAQVPVLLENEQPLWESNAILLHLALTQGKLLPTAPRARAQALQWLGWQATELNPPWGYAVHALARQTPGYDDPAQLDRSIQRWSAVMAILEQALSDGRPFMAGDGLSIADIALGLSIHRWFETPFSKPLLPQVEAYYRALRATPEGARWMPAGMV